MSWFSNIGKAVSKGVKDTKNAVVKGAKDTVSEVKRHPGTYAALAGTVALPFLAPGLAGSIAGGAGKVAGAFGRGAGSLGSKLGGLLKSGAGKVAGAFMPDGEGNSSIWSKLAKLGLAGASLYGVHKDQQQANKFFEGEVARRNAQDQRALEAYNSKAPMRDAAMAKLGSMMQKPGRFGAYLDS